MTTSPTLPAQGPDRSTAGQEVDNRLKVSIVEGVVRQIMIAMDGEGDLAVVRQFLTTLPDYSYKETDKQMMTMIQGLARQAMEAIGVVGCMTNIGQFLTSLRGYKYVESESLVTDLLMDMARRVSFQDVVELLLDEHKPGLVSVLQDALVGFVGKMGLSGTGD